MSPPIISAYLHFQNLALIVNETPPFFTALGACFYIGLVYLAFSRVFLHTTLREYQCFTKIGWSARSVFFFLQKHSTPKHTQHTLVHLLHFLPSVFSLENHKDIQKTIYIFLLFSCLLSSHWKSFWQCSQDQSCCYNFHYVNVEHLV